MPTMSDSSVEELIEIVREHPSSYDVTGPDHMDGNVSKNICVYRIYVKHAPGCSVHSGLVVRPAFTGDVTETIRMNGDRQYGGLYGHGHVKWRHSFMKRHDR